VRVLWRSRRQENVEWGKKEKENSKPYHFAVVRVESLVDQGKLFTAKTTLQIQQMAKDPRLILSSHNNHYQMDNLNWIPRLVLCMLDVLNDLQLILNCRRLFA
jgi:hypothetical protein